MTAAANPVTDLDLISVVVPTRNRPDHAAECLASILGCDDDNFTITLVDQSDDARTREVVERLADPRVRHVATDTRGAAWARNIGMSESVGSIIAFTDDDCRVDPGWISAFRAVLTDPTVAMVFGSVVKGPSDDPGAEAAQFLPTGTTTYASLPPVSEPWGISASMAIRREVLQRLHGFDVRLGPGAPINMGGEDSDLLIRVLADGHGIAATDRTVVTHLGFRSGAHASELYRGYAYALGAVFIKHLRLGTRPGRGQLAKWLVHFSRLTVANVVRKRRPTGAGFVAGLLRGAAATARTPIDRTTHHFAREAELPTTGTGPHPPMRIAIGIHSLQLGGSQINTVDLASRLRDRGHDVHLFVIEQEFKVSIAPVVERAGFDLEILPAESSLRRQARHLRAVVDRHRAQVLHVYHEDHWLGPLAAIALRSRPGRALLVTNWMMENNRWLPPWTPLVVGTEALRDEALTLQRGPVWLLEPPVHLERDSPDPARAAEFRAQYGLAGDDFVAVVVTRVDRAMKLDGILRAIAATRLLGDTGLRLVIVGDGDAMETVQRSADDANAHLGRDAVISTGALHDPRPAYDAADVLLGMGGSALRALSFGKPLIVLGEEGFSRIFSPETASYFLRHGYHGVGGDDISGAVLANQISSLFDPELRATLGEFGSSLVRERYSLDVTTDRLEQMYVRALASPRGALQRWGDVAYVLGYDFVHRRFPPTLRQAIRRRVRRLRTE